jgi:hypothetical protein
MYTPIEEESHMPATYKIYPIYLGEIPVHDKSSFTYMVDPGVKMTCPFISFLLLGSNGRKILVDTGPCDTEWGAYAFKHSRRL